jgi:hypothetical protein
MVSRGWRSAGFRGQSGMVGDWSCAQALLAIVLILKRQIDRIY